MNKLNLDNLNEDEIIVLGDALYNYRGNRHKLLLSTKDITRKNRIRLMRDTAQNFYDQVKKKIGNKYSTSI